MPTYQYACPDCGNKFELKQKFTDDAVKQCPICGKRHLYRVVGQVAVSFKGSGWYITDSKSSSDKHTLEHKKKEPTSSDAPATDGEKSENKTENKTETKTEVKAESKPSTDKQVEKPKSQ